MNDILDSMLARLGSAPGDRSTLASVAHDAGHLLRPREERAVTTFLQELTMKKRSLKWLGQDDWAFEAGALYAIEEVLVAALTGARAARVHEQEERAVKTIAGRILDALRTRGSLRPYELADLLDVSGPQISRALLRLKRSGMVRQCGPRPGEDGRTRRYELAEPELDRSEPVDQPVLDPVADSGAWLKAGLHGVLTDYPDSGKEAELVTTKEGLA